MRIALYIIAIITANIITTAIAPTEIFGLLVPAGSWLIGLTFIMRDFVQAMHGRKITYMVIGAALAMSAITSFIMDQGLMIVVASAAAFLISETTDTEVYTRLRLPMRYRVLWSGIVGGVLDSVVFVLIAGFPAIAIVGQMVVKMLLQVLGASMISKNARSATGTTESA